MHDYIRGGVLHNEREQKKKKKYREQGRDLYKTNKFGFESNG